MSYGSCTEQCNYQHCGRQCGAHRSNPPLASTTAAVVAQATGPPCFVVCVAAKRASNIKSSYSSLNYARRPQNNFVNNNPTDYILSSSIYNNQPL